MALVPGRLDRLGKPGQPVAAHDEHVADAAVGQLGADAGPELRALAGLDPDPQHVLDAVHVDADGDVRGLVAHVRAVADLHDQRVEVDHRVERFERPALPGQHLLEDLVGDLADRLVGQLGAQRGAQVVLDVADRHPAGIEADDHVVEPTKAPGALRHQPRDEATLAITRGVQLDVTDAGRDRLRGRAVARVGEQRRLRSALLIAQMPGQLGLQPPLERGLDQPGDEALRAGQVELAGIDLGEDLIQRPEAAICAATSAPLFGSSSATRSIERLQED